MVPGGAMSPDGPAAAPAGSAAVLSEILREPLTEILPNSALVCRFAGVIHRPGDLRHDSSRSFVLEANS